VTSGIKGLVQEYLKQYSPSVVDKGELARLTRFVKLRMSPQRKISTKYILRVASETGVEIARSLDGLPVDLRGRVHFRDTATAAASLLDLTHEYTAALTRDNQARKEDCRRAVRQAKDLLKQHLRRKGISEEQQKEKRELLEWFLVWLETPELFPQWLALRQRTKHLPK